MICRKCGENKEISLFYKNKGNPSGYHHSCKDCMNKQKKETVYNRLYGISFVEYNKKLEEQGGVCAICGNPPGGKALAVDHNHTTGKVRALLCTKCNTALGLLNEEPILFERALEYLEYYEERE